MLKRKSEACPPLAPVSLTSLDAALDILACDTFTRLDYLANKFEAAAGVKLNDGVVSQRWEEAVQRYWVMKSMDDLCCGTAQGGDASKAKSPLQDHTDGESNDRPEERDRGGRLLPSQAHPGAPVVHHLNADEESQWRRWHPKTGDAVLVELSDDSVWPGKIIDKKTFFQGRTQPRGNHFFAVRIYNEDLSPTVTVKSRLLPFHLRPDPPLLASTAVLGAYNHANNPTSFDMRAFARESLDAHQRTHPGVGAGPDVARIKAEKAAWNELVNWVMSERRVEKLRALEEERNKRLQLFVKSEDIFESIGEKVESEDVGQKKRKTTSVSDILSKSSKPSKSERTEKTTIFGAGAAISPSITPRRIASPSLASFIRPALSTPQRPQSPRRLEKRRSVYAGVGDSSPRTRGGNYTPPRILPSGDETAPFANGSSAPSLQSFDFVSPLGPVRMGRLESGGNLGRSNSLEVVPEEGQDDGCGGEWEVVQSRRGRRAGSMPCRDKSDLMSDQQVSMGQQVMTVDA